MLVYISIFATVSLVVTEILLIISIRLVVKELRSIRQETPRMLGASMGLSLLLGAAQFYKSGVAKTDQGP